MSEQSPRPREATWSAAVTCVLLTRHAICNANDTSHVANSLLVKSFLRSSSNVATARAHVLSLFETMAAMFCCRVVSFFFFFLPDKSGAADEGGDRTGQVD